MIGFSAHQKRVHPSIPPLLLRCPRSVSRSPRRHSTIIRFPDCAQRNPTRFGFLSQRVGVRKLPLPFQSVIGFPSFHSLVRLEPHIRFWILPRHPAKLLDLSFALGVPFCRQPGKIPNRRILSCLHYSIRRKRIFKIRIYLFNNRENANLQRFQDPRCYRVPLRCRDGTDSDKKYPRLWFPKPPHHYRQQRREFLKGNTELPRDIRERTETPDANLTSNHTYPRESCGSLRNRRHPIGHHGLHWLAKDPV